MGALGRRLEPWPSKEPRESTCPFDRRNSKKEKETQKGEGGFFLGQKGKIRVKLPLFLCSFLVYKFVNKCTWDPRGGREIVNQTQKEESTKVTSHTFEKIRTAAQEIPA